MLKFISATYQYGVPMKLFRLLMVAVIFADTPKSAETQTTLKRKNTRLPKSFCDVFLTEIRTSQHLPSLTSPSFVSNMFAP